MSSPQTEGQRNGVPAEPLPVTHTPRRRRQRIPASAKERVLARPNGRRPRQGQLGQTHGARVDEKVAGRMRLLHTL